MFFSIVNVGKYVAFDYQTNESKTFRVPPLLPDSKTKRYDSVYNKTAKHFIVYDNSKAYPGYLITYT